MGRKTEVITVARLLCPECHHYWLVEPSRPNAKELTAVCPKCGQTNNFASVDEPTRACHAVDSRLLRLRVELFAAAQVLRGDDAREFWQLVDEINAIRPLHEVKS